MKWFETYTSNTLGGSGNQIFFATENEEAQKGRIYYKVFSGGTYHYSLLFSNIIDSTYGEGDKSHCNLICDEWELLGASVGICKEVSAEQAGTVETWIPLTFEGKREKTVKPGEFFTSDPVELTACKGDFICYEVEYKGQMIPYHLESILPSFVETDGEWVPSKLVPFPGMIGCDRKVKARVGYLGDSITQGIGTPPNAYTHWNALTSEAIGEQYSYWNLGIGYGRGQDAASGGAWLFKAKQMDAVVVAYGSNDVGRGRSLDQMKSDLTAIVDQLKEAGIKVFLISVPPFDWKEDYLERWNGINTYVVEELSKKADGFLHIAPLLTDENREGVAKYGTHPDEEGCRIWAEALTPLLKEMLENM